MRLSELRTGMLVETRRKGLWMVVGDFLVNRDHVALNKGVFQDLIDEQPQMGYDIKTVRSSMSQMDFDSLLPKSEIVWQSKNN